MPARILYPLHLASPTFIPKAMSRKFVVAAVLASCLATPGWSQAPSATPGAARIHAGQAPCNEAGSENQARREAADCGRKRSLPARRDCGDRRSVFRAEIRHYEILSRPEENEVSIEDWGLDELAFARVPGGNWRISWRSEDHLSEGSVRTRS